MTPRLGLLLVLTATISCGVPLGPDRGDPADFVLAQPFEHLCRGWSPNAPSQALGLFDIYFDGTGSPPISPSIRRVVLAGGTIVRKFQVNGLRAILPIESATRIGARYLRSVSDPAVTEHPVDLGFNVAGKTGVILEHGGRVLWMATTIPDFYAIVPDSGIAAIRRDPELRYLELSLPSCANVNGVPLTTTH